MTEIDKHDPSPLTETRHFDPRSADVTATESSMQPKRLLAGFGWNTGGQFLVVAISLGLTPFLLHHLGATLYGIFALVSSARGLLSNLDGGLAPTGSRYFPVYVGRGDVAVTTSLLLTMLTLVVIIVGAVTTAMILVAPAAVGVFAHGSGLAGHSHEAVQLIRYLMPVLLVAAIRTPFQRLVMAHHRWAFLNCTTVMATVAYAATAVGVSFATSGLQCLIWATYAQEVVLLITAAWACRRYISLKRLRWLPISEVRQILRFGGRVQIAALASSFNYEVDALLMGFLFPVRYVAYYSIGANFTQQVSSLPINGLNPIVQDMGRSYGRSGKEGVLRAFPHTQRMWVTALGIYPMIAVLEGWFGIRVWLGPGAQLAAATAVLLVIGIAPLQLNSIVDVTAKVVGMPEIESWYLGIGMAVNVACTVPLALSVGVIGVPLGTAIGQVISFVVCICLARKRIGKRITPFFCCISYVPALVAIAVAGVCEWSLRDSLPTGGIGFVLSGLLTVPAFLIYYGWVYRELLLQRLGTQTVGAHRRGRRLRLRAQRRLAARARSGQPARVQATMPRVGLAADQWPGSGGRLGTVLGQVSRRRSVFGDQSDLDAQQGTHARPDSRAAADDQTVIFAAQTGDAANGQSDLDAQQGTHARPDSRAAADDQTVIFAAQTGDAANGQSDLDAQQGTHARPDSRAAADDQTVIFAAQTGDAANGQSDLDAQQGTHARPDSRAAADDQTVIFAAQTGDAANGQSDLDAQQETHGWWESRAAADDQTVILPPLIWGAAKDQVVVGNIPQLPPGFQPRPDLQAELSRAAAGVSVVHATTWAPGVGKTQLVAAYARAKQAAGWRLVAWVNAENADSLLAGLAAIADSAGLREGGSWPDTSDAGRAVRDRLEADGNRCLIVFDNASDPDVLRPFVPAAGKARVLITSNWRSMASLGTSVLVDVFTAEEALAFLAGRTGLADDSGAAAVAAELGYLPLALAVAAAAISEEHLAYGTYLERLRAVSAERYLVPGRGLPYPHGVAEAVMLTLDAVRAGNRGDVCAGVMELVAVLSAVGVSRDLLRAAGQEGVLARRRRRSQVSAALVDRALALLVERSLLSFTTDGQVVIAHRLVVQVVRDRLARRGRLAAACRAAAFVLDMRAREFGDAPDRMAARDILKQITAVVENAAEPAAEAGDELARVVLPLRFWALYHLNELGDSAPQAIAVGEPLVADFERLLGPDHPDTLGSRNNLAAAYQAAGRADKAIPLFEQTLAARVRLLGPDHPDTLSSRNNLAAAYQAAGRADKAIPLFEQTLAARVRLLGPDHPDTLATRSSVALAYQKADRAEE